MVVAVVVDDLAVDAHILDTTVLIHDDVVVRPCAGHATGEDVGSTVIVLVPVHVRRDNYLAKWSVSSPMALGETPTLADAKADIYIYQIIEQNVNGFCQNYGIKQ